MPNYERFTSDELSVERSGTMKSLGQDKGVNVEGSWNKMLSLFICFLANDCSKILLPCTQRIYVYISQKKRRERCFGSQVHVHPL